MSSRRIETVKDEALSAGSLLRTISSNSDRKQTPTSKVPNAPPGGRCATEWHAPGHGAEAVQAIETPLCYVEVMRKVRQFVMTRRVIIAKDELVQAIKILKAIVSPLDGIAGAVGFELDVQRRTVGVSHATREQARLTVALLNQWSTERHRLRVDRPENTHDILEE